MDTLLTAEQLSLKNKIKAFVDHEIAPHVQKYDAEGILPPNIIEKVGKAGYLGATVPRSYNGTDLDAMALGLLNQEFNKVCTAVRSLLTVQGMVTLAIAKWGTDKQRQQWLPRLATGQTIGAFALTEPGIGSDAKHIETTAGDQQDHYRISGQKKWISFGQIADLFLVIARCKDKPTAFLVERDTSGLEIEPMTGVLGGGALMLARLKFNNCRIPKGNMLGTVGTGFSHVASIALDYGRFSVAWGCVGMAQACLARSIQYARKRKQFGVVLREHQLVQAMLTDMTVQVKAATLMCKHAALLRQSQDPAAMGETLSAKYFAAKMINAVARDTVQIHGANGLSQDYPVSRFLRDAKAMEIIEGTNQMHQILIAKYMIHSGI